MKCSVTLFLLCFSTLNYAQNMPDDNSLAIDFIELLGELDSDSNALDFAMTQLATKNTNAQAVNPQQLVTQKPNIQKSSIQKSTTMSSKKSPTGGEKQ